MNAEPTITVLACKRRRAAAILFYCGFLIWFTFIAASRWNGVPADTSFTRPGDTLFGEPLDPELDRTPELLVALAAIPNERFSPPDGVHWPPGEPIRPENALQGPWTPKSLPYLQAIIDLLNTPDIQRALSLVAAIRPGVCVVTCESRERIKYVQDLLCARAGYRHAGQHDVDAACDDLEILLRFAGLCMSSPNTEGLGNGRNAEAKAETEISRMVFANDLTRTQANRLITLLSSNLPDDHVLWHRHVEALASWHLAELDQTYTIDNAGDGWLVLSRIDMLNNDPSSYPRCGLWNCFSPLFNSRRTVAGKIARVRQELEAVDKLARPDILRALADFNQHVPFNLLDGPLLNGWTSADYIHHWDALARQIGLRRATIAGIALSAYRGEHDEYPRSLEPLVGDYLDAIPLDPYSNEPLLYFWKPEEDDYMLYSVGTNMVDDGGGRGSKTSADDIVFGHTRPE